MKSSKRTIRIAILAAVLMVGANTYDALAFQRPRNPGHGGSGNNVGAPIDGGILTLLLGGAGAAYLAFKKKKNQ